MNHDALNHDALKQDALKQEDLKKTQGQEGHMDTGEKLSHRQKEVLSIYKKFNKANRHKMEPIPVCKIPSGL